MNAPQEIDKMLFDKACNVSAWLIFAIALLTYWLTTEPSASYWDCPEYITVASRLEVGHPPGNPTWALAANFFSGLAPGPQYISLAINLTSGLFTSFAVYFLALLIFRYASAALGCFSNSGKCPTWKCAAVLCAGATGSLCFAWCDSAWFSAVEAEVYAFSLFFTAAILHFMYKWSDNLGKASAGRYLVLVSYLLGLSIGVHQLTLLCIPALALIYLFRRRDNIRKRRLIATLLVSFALVALVLYGLMPGMAAIAQKFELFFVNVCGADYYSGALIYAALLIAVAVITLTLFHFGYSRRIASLSTALLLGLSGIFGASEQFLLSIVLSVVCGAMVFYLWRRKRNALYVCLWSLIMAMTGYSTYTLILVRGAANPPMNQSEVSNIFAFTDYLGREQYGKKPLIYGRTINSRILRKETGNEKTGYSYSDVFRDRKKPLYAPYLTGARASGRSRLMDAGDSSHNEKIKEKGKGYFIKDYAFTYRYAPELDMWFPRMISGNPDDFESYESWSGMTHGNMVRVMASEAVDTAGNAVGKYDAIQRKRVKTESARPSYLHNLAYMVTYQIGYMYLRYLMWNFSGRQNDMHSTGEAEHGNFITGITPVDNAMLGNQDLLPPRDGKNNAGRNCYYMLPFLLAIAGMIMQYRSGRKSGHNAMVLTVLFIMTGMAIVIYLNQDPGEPRERDYSFIGSFFAFSAWIGLGAAWICKACAGVFKKNKTVAISAASVICLGVPALMFEENLEDHNRAHRYATRDFAANLLLSMEKNAIVFVNGDNNTFPLWYAQEVEGIRRDVRVVSISYLSTPWYAPQMMRQSYNSSPLPFTAKASDVAYGRFALTYFKDSLPADARTAFSSLYSSKNTRPELCSSVLRIPGQSNDSIYLNLKEMIPGNKKFMTLSQLLMLDIVATNAYSRHPRPIYWLSTLRAHHLIGLLPLTERQGPLLKLHYGGKPSERQTAMRMYDLITQHYRWGNLKDRRVYADETVRRQARNLRMQALQTAAALIQSGEPERALNLAELIETEIPDSTVPFTTLTYRYLPYHEALELADIYLSVYKLNKDEKLRAHALRLIGHELSRLSAWRSFYTSLSPAKRAVMSPKVLLESSELYTAMDMWLRAGGDQKKTEELISEHKLVIPEERRNRLKNLSLRRMLRESRFPSDNTDSVMHSLYRDFLKNGGDKKDLTNYGELKDLKL